MAFVSNGIRDAFEGLDARPAESDLMARACFVGLRTFSAHGFMMPIGRSACLRREQARSALKASASSPSHALKPLSRAEETRTIEWCWARLIGSAAR